MLFFYVKKIMIMVADDVDNIVVVRVVKIFLCFLRKECSWEFNFVFFDFVSFDFSLI